MSNLLRFFCLSGDWALLRCAWVWAGGGDIFLIVTGFFDLCGGGIILSTVLV